MDSSNDSLVIGIDLGTTNSCASYYVDKFLEILVDPVPSCVFFDKKGTQYVGHVKSLAELKPERGIYEMKRLLGREFSDTRVQEMIQIYPFPILEVDGKPIVHIDLGDKYVIKTPQELCSVVLSKIKADAEGNLSKLEQKKCQINKAVITVPAYFNNLQRKQTLQAAKQAGFTVLKLLNEPSAAALNFYFENQNLKNDQHILVYDLRAATFDVSILKESSGNVVEVLCVDGDSHLGGNDFDNLIVNFICEYVFKTYNSIVERNKRNMQWLHNRCEAAKKNLSLMEDTEISLVAFVEGHDEIVIPFSRQQFENLIGEILKKTLDITARCISNSNIKKEDIGKVLLAGGSTRIPKVHALLSEYFGEGILKNTRDPQKCVAYGAALQAAMLSQHPRQVLEKVKIEDVLPLSIGTVLSGNLMNFLIEKGKTIPVTVSNEFTNDDNNQKTMSFKIYEGERFDCRKNYLLGEVVLNITPAPLRECVVIFTVCIDSLGILKCTAEEKATGNKKIVEIDFYIRGIRSDSEIRRAIEDAERNQIENEKFKAFTIRISYLIEYCKCVIYNMEIKKLDDSHTDIYNYCKNISNKLMNESDDSCYDTGAVDNIVGEVKEKCDDLVKSYNFVNMPEKFF